MNTNNALLDELQLNISYFSFSFHQVTDEITNINCIWFDLNIVLGIKAIVKQTNEFMAMLINFVTKISHTFAYDA